jgi:nicotinamidase-related amidase
LLIDVINGLAFDGAEALISEEEPMASRLAELKRRVAKAGVPVIYINDDLGQWRSAVSSARTHVTGAG